MTVKKKWCRLHGRCPHEDDKCLRCDPPQELTEGARRRAMMRGFKLPKRIRTKEFIQRFNIRS